MRILSGVQPSGMLHLGNYLGAIQQFLRYQDTSDEKPLYFIADLHALTSVRDGNTLATAWHNVALDYLAFGLDPRRAILYRQSDIPEIALFSWILSTVTPMGLLERSHSYKDKVAHGVAADVGLFTYPVLMSADILMYGAGGVPVGKDQKQHLEITRDICTKFNMTYVPGYQPEDPTGVKSGVPGILKMPEPLIMADTAVVPGLDGQKMSKSYDNTLEIFADAALLRKKIMGIKTDSTPVEAPKPADAPLLALLQLLAPKDEAQEHARTWQEGGVGYGTYKKRLFDLFMETFDDARQRRVALQSDVAYVQRVLREGAEEARAIALPYLNAVKRAVGI